MADSTVVHSIDSISELPKDILEHIQSLLSMKEVARNSVLSKTWKQVSAPKNLEFDFTFFYMHHWWVVMAFIISHNNGVRRRYKSEENEYKEIQRALMKTNRRIEHVDQILAPFGKHKLSMNKFRLEIYFFKLDWSSRFDKWIQQAVASNVQHLFIHIKLPNKSFSGFESDLYKLYSLPHCILVAKSIVTLEIMSCKLELIPADFKTNLSSLKKLSLVNVYLNDYALHKIIVGCSLIEELIIEDCWGFKTLHIPKDLNFPNLQVLEINKCMKLKTLKIESHRLEYLEIFCCQNLVEIKLDAPCLSKFSYYGDHVEFSWNTLVRCSVYLYLNSSSQWSQNYLELSWYLKRVEFLAKFNNRCRELTLMCFNHKELIFSDEFRQRIDPPLPDLKKLVVKVPRKQRELHKEKLINCIRWMSPHSEKEYALYNWIS